MLGEGEKYIRSRKIQAEEGEKREGIVSRGVGTGDREKERVEE